MLDSYFILHADCKLVNGFNRSMIYDLTRTSFSFIPSTLYEILSTDDELTISEIITKYGKEHEAVILEYFDFLKDKEYVFFTSSLDERLDFPAISTNWESPYSITNVILDYKERIHPIEKIIEELESLGSIHLQLRFYSEKLLGQINKILNATLNSRIKSIELIMPYVKSFKIDELLEKHSRVNQVILHSCESDEIEEINGVPIQKTSTFLQDERCCGQIQKSNFSINLPLFNETENFNNCLNKKIAIDSEGNIKNCPSMKTIYGKSGQDSLKEIAESAAFKKIWGVKKSLIETCKDCEFRNMCIDCRAYTDDPKNIYSKPLKCGYDPYTNKWEEWSTNPLKQKAIAHYGLKDIVQTKS